MTEQVESTIEETGNDAQSFTADEVKKKMDSMRGDFVKQISELKAGNEELSKFKSESDADKAKQLEAKQLEESKHMEVIAGLKEQITTMETAAAETIKAGQLKDLDYSLERLGMSNGLSRKGAVAGFEIGGDIDEYIKGLQESNPDSFGKVVQGRSSGNVGTVNQASEGTTLSDRLQSSDPATRQAALKEELQSYL